MSRPIPPTYKTRNWPAYNEALKRRGSLTIWFDPAMMWGAAPTGKRGRQPDDSNAAIQTCLTMKVLFGMALRHTTGFVESLLRLIGLDWAVPDFSTLSRRQKTALLQQSPIRPQSRRARSDIQNGPAIPPAPGNPLSARRCTRGPCVSVPCAAPSGGPCAAPPV